MSLDNHRTARLAARTTPEVLAVLRRAAELQGRSVSDFVLSAALEVAQRTISEIALIKLSLEDQALFAAALIDPPPLPEGFKRAAEAHAELIVGER